MGILSEPTVRADRMMMLTPSRTAPSARAQSSSSTCSMPAAPRPAWKVVSSVRDLKWVGGRAGFERGGGGVGERADFLQIRVGEDRLAPLKPLGRREPLEVEQVRPRS